VTSVAKPVRERYARRADALIQSYAGKDMAAVLALGDAKKVIEGTLPMPEGMTSVADTPAAPTAESSFRSKGGSKVKFDPSGHVWEVNTAGSTAEFFADGSCKLNWSNGTTSVNQWTINETGEILLSRDGVDKGRIVFRDSKMKEGVYSPPGGAGSMMLRLKK
jgi:hypothetical protein